MPKEFFEVYDARTEDQREDYAADVIECVDAWLYAHACEGEGCDY